MKELRFPRVNNVIITGRLTREVELRYTSSGTAVTKLPIAFDRSYKKNGEWVQEASFIDVTVWDKLAEKCAEELEKGSPILVEGYLKTHSYQDKNGNNRKATEIVAFKVSFLEKNIEAPNTQNEPVADDSVPF